MVSRFRTARLRAVLTVLLLAAGLLGVPAIPGLGTVAAAQPSALWEQMGGDIDGEAANDQSGSALAISANGDAVIVGAAFNGSGSLAGHARIFVLGGAGWVQRGGDIDGEAAGDESGSAVAMSSDGDTVIIGAPKNDGNGRSAGHVRVYDWSGVEWVQRGVDIDGEAAGDQSGSAVAMSADGDTVVIGAPGNDGTGATQGHSRVYDWDGSAWVQLGADIDGDWAGDSVAMSADGDTVIIGASLSGANGAFAGHARIHHWDGTSWVQLGADINGETDFNFAGYSVDMSADGEAVIIGAPFNTGAEFLAGNARIFDWDGIAWVQRGADLDGEAERDRAGTSVSMSDDGDTVVVGSPGNGPDAGHARIFDWDGAAWVQLGVDIDGEAAGDFSGEAVAMSAPGNTVIIGAPQNDGNGSNSGHARIYRYGVVAVDLTPPVISASVTGTEGDNGWFTSDVSVTWTVTDPESATTSTTGCDPISVTTDTVATTLTCTATSAGGTDAVSVNLKRDATAPTVVAVVYPNPVLQWLSGTVFANAIDATSAVAAESCGQVNTTTLGTFDVSCSAVDLAGNEKTATVSYEVHDPSGAVEAVALALDLATTSNPTAAAAIADAVNRANQAIAKFDQGNEPAGLNKIQRALEAIEDAEAADPTLDLTTSKATLAAATKYLAITGIAAAAASGTTNHVHLWKIATAQNLVAYGDTRFVAGDYLGAATSYRRAYAKVKNIH